MPPRLPCLLNDPPVATGLTWFAGARLFNGTGAPVRERVAVLVEDGRIAAVAGAGDAPPEAARVIDLEACSAATTLGLRERVGTIEVGKLADLLVVDGDPLARPEVLLERESIWLVTRLGAPVAGTSLERNPAQPTAA